MSKQLTVSVVVPAYNEAARLSDCLQSLANQSMRPYEVIVVDNNSTDQTAAIAERHGARVVAEPRQGIGYARSCGFQAASGDIIARTDADTVLDPGWVGAIAERFAADAELIGLAGRSAIYELSPARRYWFGWIHDWFRLWHQRRLGGLTMLYGHNMALRRSAWQRLADEAADHDMAANEDVELSYRLAGLGRIGVEPRMLAKFRIKGSLSPAKLITYFRADGRWLTERSDHGR